MPEVVQGIGYRPGETIFKMIDGAVDAHAITRRAGLWTRAVVVYDDGSGADVHAPPRTAIAVA